MIQGRQYVIITGLAVYNSDTGSFAEHRGLRRPCARSWRGRTAQRYTQMKKMLGIKKKLVSQHPSSAETIAAVFESVKDCCQIT